MGSATSAPSGHSAACHPWDGLFTLALLRCQSSKQRAWGGGRGRHPRRTGPCLCMQRTTHYPQLGVRPPAPHPNLNPNHPCSSVTTVRRQTPPSHPLSSSSLLLFHQLIRKHARWNNERSICSEPGMCLNVAPTPPTPQSPAPALFPLRNRGGDCRRVFVTDLCKT